MGLRLETVKAVAGAAACENHSGTEVMWTDGGKRSWAEEYNRTYKAHRRSRCDALREIKSKYTRGKENKKQHMSREHIYPGKA